MTTSLEATNDNSPLDCDVSDDALESAGLNELVANFTLGSCTGLSECPG